MNNKLHKRKKLITHKEECKEQGITLIALVVTIIILLVLAGVTLGTVLSDGGLIDKTKEAIGEHEKAQENEKEELSEAAGMMKNLIDGLGSTGGTTPTTPEGPKTVVTTVTKITDETVYGEDSLGNPVVIPGGFKFAGDPDDTVEDGIIIEDDEGNQFVWIPVSNTDGNNDGRGTGLINRKDKEPVEITLGRYTFATSTPGTPTPVQKGSEHSKSSATTIIKNTNNYEFYENTNEEGRPNGGAGAKNLAEFIQSVQDNHGYYLARYEASYKSGTSVNDYKIYTKQSTSCSTGSWSNTPGRLWNWITQPDASTVSRNMYSGSDIEAGFVESDLVNSYAWDTAIVYIQAMGNENYANAKDGNGSLKNTGETNDVKCNIYDMAGNLYECITEYSTYTYSGGNHPCVNRGGGYDSSRYYPASRDGYSATYSYSDIGFRPLLYLK